MVTFFSRNQSLARSTRLSFTVSQARFPTVSQTLHRQPDALPTMPLPCSSRQPPWDRNWPFYGGANCLDLLQSVISTRTFLNHQSFPTLLACSLISEADGIGCGAFFYITRTSDFKSADLSVVEVCECKYVCIRVLLMIIIIATKHGCQSLVVSFNLLIGQWVVCRDEYISNREQLTYTLKGFRNILFFIVWEYFL